MSLEQIKREFPFLGQAWPFSDTPTDAEVEIRVSRLSLEALELPMQSTRENHFWLVRMLYVLDEKGRAIYFSGNSLDYENYDGTIGDAICRDLLPDGEETASKVAYVVYTQDFMEAIWRRCKADKKSRKTMSTRRFESVIFKVPQNKTLWQLLKRYHKSVKI